MADKFKMALAGAFFGGGQALAQVGKEKTAESGVAYDLYIKLSSSQRHKKRQGFEFKRGMTRVTVMQGFEEVEDDGRDFEFNEPIPADQREFWKVVYPELGDYPLTIGMAKKLDTMSKAEARKSLEKLKQTGKTGLEKLKQKGRLELQNIKDVAKDKESATEWTEWFVTRPQQELDKAMNDRRRPFIEDLLDIAGYTIGKDIKKGWFFDKEVSTFERKTTAPLPVIPGQGQGQVPPLAGPGGQGQVIPPPGGGARSTRPPDQDLIAEIKQYGGVREAKQALMQKYGMSGIEVEQFIKKYEAQITGQSQQITQPGLTETGTGGIEGEFGASPTGAGARPTSPQLSFDGSSPAQGTFMPNASPYNRIKTLSYLRNIPRQR